MLTGANFLLLDEPTNHLDIRSKEALEKAISDFDATVFVISHDRYLINKMADKLLVFEDGTVKCYNMNYDRYMEYRKNNQSSSPAVKKEKAEKEQSDYHKRKELQSAKNRLSGKIKRTEEAISEKEEETERLHSEINSAGSDFEKITELSEALNKCEKELETLMEQWEELCGKLEEM